MTNQIDTSTTAAMEDDLRALAFAALKVNGHLAQGLSPEQGHAIDHALRGGAQVHLEFGPVPGFESVRLVLVEREGTRHPLASISINTGTLQ
jgi:hypothetical protein